MKLVPHLYQPYVSDDQISEELPFEEFFQILFPAVHEFHLIPPLKVLNEALLKGSLEGDMGGGLITWKPFRIEIKEYEELISILVTDGWKKVSSPEWVKDLKEWHFWKFEHEVGIPSQRHRELSNEEEKWSKKSKEENEVLNEEQKMELHLRSIQAAQNLMDFTNPYLTKYRNKNHS